MPKQKTITPEQVLSALSTFEVDALISISRKSAELIAEKEKDATTLLEKIRSANGAK